MRSYDVVVIGAGHAGCEAALAAARMGCRTLVLTMNLDSVATMPCNPSIGGPAKGHLVREIDAMGGEMARVTDLTFLQVRLLNTGKGPAVQALRAQSDKRLYSTTMKRVLEGQQGLDLVEGQATDIKALGDRSGEWGGLRVSTACGRQFSARCVIVTTGTFLSGRLVAGEMVTPGGRAGEAAAFGLSDALRRLGFRLGRLKTGTPPRLDLHSIDFTPTVPHQGHTTPLYFSFRHAARREEADALVWEFGPANPAWPAGPETGRPWRPQLPCYLVHTNEATHDAIRQNLHRAPMFNGTIQARGPRYCPSIEDKVFRFPDKASHGLFLEPEGWTSDEVYVQGANTSLPEDVQEAMLRSIPALAGCRILRAGYAVEYDYVETDQTGVTLESKAVRGLFFAGQINGTSGYEEAAAQGLIAGINAARKVLGRPPVILRRDQAYIGVMLDDLVTRELTEPYRLLTSRAEYRLLLRHDNADLRLTPLGHELGLVSRERFLEVERKRDLAAWEKERLGRTFVSLSGAGVARLLEAGLGGVERSVSAAELLTRPKATYAHLRTLGMAEPDLPEEVVEQVEIECKYGGYIARQAAEVARVRRVEERTIPAETDFDLVVSLSREGRDKLKRFKPATLGQASRVSGITPADLSVLMVHLEKTKRAVPPSPKGTE